ncbi:MAG: trigger factor [Deltaproteobacteria bacterium]|nr:trigger factor [Deltaproteobacteria bacterium]
MKVKTKDIKLEEISQIERRLIVEIDPEYYKEELEKTYKELMKNVAIKGFRPGKAPRSIIEKLYGSAIKEEVIHRIEKEFIQEYVEENKIEIVSPITPHYIHNDNDLRFEFKFEVKPLIVPTNYRGIEVKGKKITINDEEVDSVLNDIVDRYSNLVPKESDTIQPGDFVKFTIISHKDKKMNNKPIYVELNEKKTKKFIIDALIGKKLNEEIEVNTNEDSEEKMKIRIDEIKKVERPELNDEFVKKYLQMESLDLLKKDVAERIKQRKENEEKVERFENIIKEIIARNPFPVPPSMISRAIDKHIHDLENSSNRKFSREEYEAIANSIRDNITYEIQKLLIMESIGKLEGIDINDDDLEAHFKRIADESGENVIKVKAYYEKNNLIEDLKSDLRFNKIKEFLINEANITVE